jgi:hypothetical protein
MHADLIILKYGNSSLSNFLQPPVISPLGSKYSPQHHVLKHPQSIFFSSNPQKTTCKIIFLISLHFLNSTSSRHSA